MRTTVLGVPSSAGAYCVGVERAPGALRAAGLVEQLRASGTDVVDAGDLTTRLWFPDRERPFAQNLGEEADALVELSTAAASLLAADQRLLVLGGSCTVAVGLCDAMARAGERPRLVYIDRHLDLNTPRSTTEGSLSWMGMAHALGLEGAAPELVDLMYRTPLLRPSELVYLGVDLSRETTDWERGQAAEHRIAVVDQTALCDDPRRAAADARRILASGPVPGASRCRRTRLSGRADRRERERPKQRADHRDTRTGTRRAARRSRLLGNVDRAARPGACVGRSNRDTQARVGARFGTELHLAWCGDTRSLVSVPARSAVS